MSYRALMIRFATAAVSILVVACATATEDLPFVATEIAILDEPWAMSFLPDGRLLITEKKGVLRVVTQGGDQSGPISGVPDVDYGGQGGLGDVIIHPDYADNGIIYLSYAEAGEDDTRGAAVARAQLALDSSGGSLSEMQVIWRQEPKVKGRGHYGHRMAFSESGYLFISSGERQKFDPAQDMQANLGKIVRLNDDGSVPEGNPFAADGGIATQFWTLGHRNPLGIAFDADGQLWNIEMGPRGGDEINRVERGKNYGYPTVSNGKHYSGKDIPNHDTRPEFEAPKAWWTPVISPSSFIIYSGELFPEWRGDGFITGLSSEALVRIKFDGENAREAERFEMGERIRAVKQGPGGAIWLLEDEEDDEGKGGRLLKLTPVVDGPGT
jgi:glucose/arabinose dehydrogenase